MDATDLTRLNTSKVIVIDTDGVPVAEFGGGGGGASTIADGADVTKGAIADASVAAGATGTVSAKLRRISADIASVLTAVQAATPAGTNTIGNVGVATTSNATNANVDSSTSAVTLLAANAARKSASIWNDSTSVLYVAEFPTATATVSATNCTTAVAPGGFFTVSPEYNGLVQGIWVSVNGKARVTEH